MKSRWTLWRVKPIYIYMYELSVIFYTRSYKSGQADKVQRVIAGSRNKKQQCIHS